MYEKLLHLVESMSHQARVTYSKVTNLIILPMKPHIRIEMLAGVLFNPNEESIACVRLKQRVLDSRSFFH